MQFIYVKLAGDSNLCLSTKEYAHIFKVRRVCAGASLDFRNFKDNYTYTYKIETINKKEAILKLIDKKIDAKPFTSSLHVGWCVVDAKTIEKNIAMLNEMGVSKVTFVYAKYSQKSYKIDEKRLERILIGSSQQCGRSSILQVEILASVKEYLELYPKSVVIDFSKNMLDDKSQIDSFLVGPEGGFSEEERSLFVDTKVYGLKSNTILRSQTVVVGVCAKLSM